MAQVIAWPSFYKGAICAAKIVTIPTQWGSVTIVVTVFQPVLSKPFHYKMVLFTGTAQAVSNVTPVFNSALVNQAQ